MSDEINDDVVVEGDAKEEISSGLVRKSSLFLQQARLASEYKMKLEEIEKSLVVAEQEKQRKVLEEKGSYDEILRKKDEELNSIKNLFEKELAKEKLSNKILLAGLTHPVAVKAAIAGYDFNNGIEGIEEYVQGVLKSEDFSIFLSKPGAVGPVTITPAKNTSTNWDEIREDLKNPQKSALAQKKLESYLSKHGKLPWN